MQPLAKFGDCINNTMPLVIYIKATTIKEVMLGQVNVGIGEFFVGYVINDGSFLISNGNFRGKILPEGSFIIGDAVSITKY